MPPYCDDVHCATFSFSSWHCCCHVEGLEATHDPYASISLWQYFAVISIAACLKGNTWISISQWLETSAMSYQNHMQYGKIKYFEPFKYLTCWFFRLFWHEDALNNQGYNASISTCAAMSLRQLHRIHPVLHDRMTRQPPTTLLCCYWFRFVSVALNGHAPTMTVTFLKGKRLNCNI